MKLDEQLPQTTEEFDIWVDKVLSSYGFEVTNANRHAIAEHILHMDQKATFMPDEYFAKALSRRIANQTAYYAVAKYKAEYEAQVKAKEDAIEEQAKQDAQKESSPVEPKGV